jgi:hypothetical protein
MKDDRVYLLHIRDAIPNIFNYSRVGQGPFYVF